MHGRMEKARGPMKTKVSRRPRKKPTRRPSGESFLNTEQKKWYEARLEEYKRESGTDVSLEQYIREILPREAEVREELLRRVREELNETRERLAAAEQECFLTREQLSDAESKATEADARSEKLRDLYVRATESADKDRARGTEIQQSWKQASELAIRQSNEIARLRAAVETLTARVEKACHDCGSGGPLYVFEERAYCAACLSKRRPPLPYAGPERRRTQKPTMWRRRATDQIVRKPGNK